MANMKSVMFNGHKIVAKIEGNGLYSFLIRYKGRNIVFKTIDSTLYEDIDSIERRAKAAKSYVYESVKDIFYVGVNSDIEVGGYYECIKDLVVLKKVCYKRGEVYRSGQSGCITDCNGCAFHDIKKEVLEEYFIKR